MHRVVTEHGRDDVTKRARRRGVDFHLVVLKAHPEPRFARAAARLGPFARTTLTDTVAPVLVGERLQPQLEHTRTARLIEYRQ